MGRAVDVTTQPRRMAFQGHPSPGPTPTPKDLPDQILLPTPIPVRRQVGVSSQTCSQWQAPSFSFSINRSSSCGFCKPLAMLKDPAPMSPPLGSPPCLLAPSSLLLQPWIHASWYIITFFSPVMCL